ncbi:MAG: LCP family protein [Chloroflexi bacterium]|nr:LCP family protein [Chloroflexota bacterium]
MDNDSSTPPHGLGEQSDYGRRLRPGKKTLLFALIALLVLGAQTTWLLLGPSDSTSPSRPNERLLSPNASPEVEREIEPVTDADSVVTNGSPEQLDVPSKDVADPRIGFVLLGYGGGGHDGAYLTDSMMVVIADPRQKTLALLSIPRDSWVPMLFDGKTAVYGKLNTAYAFARDPSLYPKRLERYTGSRGAGSFVVDTLSRILGVPISNYLGLDFDGFRQMINAVGGIEVNVPASFAARYPANDNPAIDPSWKIVRFNKGVERMNGERAIQFARARESIDNISEGSDFARSRRQRIIMEAFKTRLFEPGGLIQLPQILTIAARHVDTDYAITDVGQLRDFILDWKNVQVFQTAVTGANYLQEGTGYNGAYVLVPGAADRSWAQIRAFTRKLWADPAVGVAMADTKIVIVNDTGKEGAAARLGAALVRLGYRVGPPESGPGRAESRLVDRTGGRARILAEQLGRDLGVTLPYVAETVAGRSDELVIDLGADHLSLADLEVPIDDAAPSSTVGIERFGVWQPAPTPTPTESPETPTPTDSPEEDPPPSPWRLLQSTPTRRDATPATSTPTPPSSAATPVSTPNSGATATPTPVPTKTPMVTPRSG